MILSDCFIDVLTLPKLAFLNTFVITPSDSRTCSRNKQYPFLHSEIVIAELYVIVTLRTYFRMNLLLAECQGTPCSKQAISKI